MVAFKRVMSKNCNEDTREEKKYKTQMNFGGKDGGNKAGLVAGEILKQLAIDASDAANNAPASENDVTFPNVPVVTISHNESRASTTFSSLSGEGGDMRTEGAAAALRPRGCGDGFAASNNKNAAAASDGSGVAAITGMTRQVSIDDCSNCSTDKNSLDGSSSSSTTSEANKGTSVGNWGWFDEVHGQHESLFLPEISAAKDGGDGDTPAQSKKKKGGLLHIGSELMHNVLQAIVEPHRQASNTMAVTAPTYVLEESLSNQKLWKHTAGNRPPQPVEERAFFEQMWAQNFTVSKVKYEIPVEVLTASTPISISPFNDDGFIGEEGAPGGNNLSGYNLAGPFDEDGVADPELLRDAQANVAAATLIHHLNSNEAVMYFDPNRPKDYNLKTLGPHHHHHTLVNKKVKGAGEENDLTVVVRGDNVFGTTVSKSFPRVNDTGEPMDGIDTISISIASYRVVESKKQGKYAQYLVIFCDGNFRNTVGVWKRYSDFSELSRKVTHGHESCAAVVTGLNPLSVTDDHDAEILPNAITSWKLLKKRQRWYRCLDAGYLSLKVFLLERFLHDILFESSNPQILRGFVGVNSSEGSKLNIKG